MSAWKKSEAERKKSEANEGLESPGGGKGRAFIGCHFVQKFEGTEGGL